MRRRDRGRYGCVLLVALFLLPGLGIVAWRTCADVVDYQQSKP